MTSKSGEKSDALATVDPVGRTWPDLLANSEFGPRLDRVLSDLLDWGVEHSKAGMRRVVALLKKVQSVLDKQNVEPIPVPARVGLEILSNVAREEREELHDLWASLLVSVASGHAVDAFYIDLVRKLDSDSAQILGVVSEAAEEAVRRYPFTEDEGYGGGDAPGAGDGDGDGDGTVLGGRFQPLKNREKFVEEAVEEGREPGAGGEAVARLLALGLVERNIISEQLCVTPAGSKLLRLVRPR